VLTAEQQRPQCRGIAVSGMVPIRCCNKQLRSLYCAGNASDSDGGEQRPDLLGIGYGSDGVGSEGKDAKREEVRGPAHGCHWPCVLLPNLAAAAF